METQHTHIVSYKTNFIIWLILIALTIITVYVAELELGTLSVAVALLVASIKGFLVLRHFMHLKYDDKLLSILVGIVFMVFAVLIIFTFVDYSLR